MTEDCVACGLATGRLPLPGGSIHHTEHWLVEHCIGALGVGTLVVKPARHVVHVAELSPAEVDELGPLLVRTARVVTRLCDPDQVYTCLWSHAGGRPVHIHFVVQPVSKSSVERYGGTGPHLQAAMFAEGTPPDPAAVEQFAARARQAFTDDQPSGL